MSSNLYRAISYLEVPVGISLWAFQLQNVSSVKCEKGYFN